MQRHAWLILAGCLVATTACGSTPSQTKKPQPASVPSSAPAAKAPAQTALTFSLDFLPAGNQAPYYLALKHGFYKAHGLKVRIVPGVNPAESTGWLVSQKVDITEDTTSVAVRFITKGAPLRIVAGTIQTNPFGLLYRKATPLHKPQDVYGRTIGVPPGTDAAAYWNAFVSLAHLNPSKVHVVNVRPTAQIGLLGEGKVDAVSTSSYGPAVVAEDRGIPSGFLPYSSFGVNGLANCIVTTDAFLKAHPGALRRFLAASAQGFAYAALHPKQAALAMHEQVAKTNPKFLADQLRTSLRLAHTPHTVGKPWGWQSIKDWQAQLSMMKRFMALKSPLPAQRYFTNAYLPSAPGASKG